MNLSNIVIILSRTADSGNVGAVCRAMKNMGLCRLRLVDPSADDEKTIISRSVHAADVWENAELYDSLEKASADCCLLIGTTRRRGKHRKSISITPRGLAQRLVEQYGSSNQAFTGTIALVFGNERTGLDDTELNMCNFASHIPVSDDFPSLNLSHAVQIYAYELFLALNPDNNEEYNQDSNQKSRETGTGPAPHFPTVQVKGEWIPLERQKVDELTVSITNT
ncbi:MAG: RNA methyltransferase, partial [Treponema sp.]|nr:RNA methyltransferase [Treponema sp.]